LENIAVVLSDAIRSGLSKKVNWRTDLQFVILVLSIHTDQTQLTHKFQKLIPNGIQFN